MPRLTITFDGADPLKISRPVARTNSESLDPGDIIMDKRDNRFRVIECGTFMDYLQQCLEADIEIDEERLMQDRDRLWVVEVME